MPKSARHIRQDLQAPDAAMAELQRLLVSAPQDLWLDTIRRTRGPVHDGLVHWMLNQPACDFAVAVNAFYRSDPIRHLEDPQPLPARPDASQIFAQVLRNWDTGSYRNHALLVGPLDMDPRIARRMNQKLMAWPRGALPFTIPSRFRAPTGGVPLCLPPHLSPDEARHLRSLYARLGLRLKPADPGLQRPVALARGLWGQVTLRRPRR